MFVLVIWSSGLPAGVYAQRGGGRAPTDLVTAQARTRILTAASRAADLATERMAVASRVLLPYARIAGVGGDTTAFVSGRPFAVLGVEADRLRAAKAALDTLLEDSGLSEFLVSSGGRAIASVQLRHFADSDSLAMSTSPDYLREIDSLRMLDARNAPVGRRYVEVDTYHCRMLGISDVVRATQTTSLVVVPTSDCPALRQQIGQRLPLAFALQQVRNSLPPAPR